jgi:hypothetical protein
MAAAIDVPERLDAASDFLDRQISGGRPLALRPR